MRRTITFCLAMRRMLMAKATEMATGSPSGMALTARPTAIRKRSPQTIPRIRPTTMRKSMAKPTSQAMRLENLASRIISGGLAEDSFPSSAAILPISLDMPVATTTPRPRPLVTRVPAKAGTASSWSGGMIFLTGADSPVSRDSSH